MGSLLFKEGNRAWRVTMRWKYDDAYQLYVMRCMDHPPICLQDDGKKVIQETRKNEASLTDVKIFRVPSPYQIGANQLIHSFLVGCLNPCLQRTNVWVGSPQPSIPCLQDDGNLWKFNFYNFKLANSAASDMCNICVIQSSWWPEFERPWHPGLDPCIRFHLVEAWGVLHEGHRHGSAYCGKLSLASPWDMECCLGYLSAHNNILCLHLETSEA